MGLQTSVLSRKAFWEPVRPRLLGFRAHGSLSLATVKVIFFSTIYTFRDARRTIVQTDYSTMQRDEMSQLS